MSWYLCEKCAKIYYEGKQEEKSLQATHITLLRLFCAFSIWLVSTVLLLLAFECRKDQVHPDLSTMSKISDAQRHINPGGSGYVAVGCSHVARVFFGGLQN